MPQQAKPESKFRFTPRTGFRKGDLVVMLRTVGGLEVGSVQKLKSAGVKTGPNKVFAVEGSNVEITDGTFHSLLDAYKSAMAAERALIERVEDENQKAVAIINKLTAERDELKRTDVLHDPGLVAYALTDSHNLSRKLPAALADVAFGCYSGARRAAFVNMSLAMAECFDDAQGKS